MSYYRRAFIAAAAIPCASAFVPLSSLTAAGAVHLRRSHHRNIIMSMSTGGTDDKNYIDKLALILINSDNKQLVARSFGKTVYYTPGGKREAGESDIEALCRECQEELDVDLLTATKTPANIVPYGTFQAQAYGKPEGTMVRLTCFRVLPRESEIELENLVKPSEEVEELKWVDSNFDRDKLTVTGIMILEDLKEKNIID
jgi:8-oxo-dGTP diphosphatase